MLEFISQRRTKIEGQTGPGQAKPSQARAEGWGSEHGHERRSSDDLSLSNYMGVRRVVAWGHQHYKTSAAKQHRLGTYGSRLACHGTRGRLTDTHVAATLLYPFPGPARLTMSLHLSCPT